VRRLLLVLVLAGLAVSAVAVHRALPLWYVDHVPPSLARHMYPLEHRDAIAAAARRDHLDGALVAGLIYVESGYRAEAVSRRGAVGLMQVLPSTANEIAARSGGTAFTAGDLRDPAVNIRYGSRYLRMLLDRYGGSRFLAVAAYNAGVRRVDAWRFAARRRGRALAAADIPFAETRHYVTRVARLATIYRRAYGFELPRP
jgi:soluble lytic murein transglycosylase